MQLGTYCSPYLSDSARVTRSVAARYWRVVVAGIAALIMVTGIAAMNHTTVQRVLTCAPGESMLVYPLYDRRGTVMDHRTMCGAPHRGCTRRSETSTTYDCSPFMAPDTLWAGGGIILN